MVCTSGNNSESFHEVIFKHCFFGFLLSLTIKSYCTFSGISKDLFIILLDRPKSALLALDIEMEM